MAWIIVAGLVVGIATAVSLRRRSHDDVHSVEGYHRQLHTLEVLRSHTAEAAASSEGSTATQAAYPGAAFKVSTHSTVRLTEPGKAPVPPVPPPPVADPDRPVTFDDAGTVVSTPTTTPGADWRDDRAMDGINHRPRRLAAPAGAVVAVVVVIILLLVTGNHTVAPPRHTPKTTPGSQETHRRTTGHTTATQPHHHAKVTTTTLAPVVSLPHSGSANLAVYAVRPSSYTLALSATSSQCWVSATQAGTGTVLFTGVLNPGQTHTVTANGAVSVVVGAPNAFAANIDGTAVSLPIGYRAPFTMQFLVGGAPQP